MRLVLGCFYHACVHPHDRHRSFHVVEIRESGHGVSVGSTPSRAYISILTYPLAVSEAVAFLALLMD